MDKWSLLHWKQHSKTFREGWFSCLALPAKLRSEKCTPPSCNVLNWSSPATDQHEHNVSWSLDCQHRSKETLCNVETRWQSPLLLLKSENHRKPQGSDTCLNFDGTAPNCPDSLAHEVNIHLSSIFLELCQDLQSKSTNVSPWGHAERTSHWQVTLLEYENTSRMHTSTANHTYPQLTQSNSAISLYLWNPLVWIRQQNWSRVKGWLSLDYFQIPLN